MDDRWRDLLVLIRVPLVGGDAECFTGLPVGRDRILTARHGLFPEELDDQQCIELQWFHQPATPSVQVPRANILWDSEDLDVALLECPLPEKLCDWRYLSSTRPSHLEPWASEGFPIGADSGGQPQAFPISGTTNGASTNADRLHLDLLPGFRTRTGWGGISGAPVIVRDQVVGVIVTVPSESEHRIKAVYAADLFKAEGFAEVLGYGPHEGRTTALRRALKAKLDRSPDACSYLRSAMRLPNGASDALCDRLIKLETPEACVEAVRKAHDAAIDKSESSVAGVLRDLLLTLLPSRFETPIVRRVRDAIDAGAQPLIESGVFTGTAAELVMAEVDGEPAELRSPNNNDAWPYPNGVYSVEHPPIEGMQDQVDDHAFRSAWETHIVNRWAKGSGFERASVAARLKVAARRLQIGDHIKRRHYVLVADEPHGQADDGEDIHARRAALVRASCPSLVFLRLTADDERLVCETQLLDALCPMLGSSPESNR